MISVAIAWLLLALPGYALLRRVWPDALAGGPLSAVAVGYLATFALLTPVSVAGYLWSLPLSVLSSAIVALIVLAIGSLLLELRSGSLRPRRPGFSPIALCAFALVANSAVAGLAIGAPLTGDGRYHIARVRMLLDHGFNSLDPLVAGRIDSVYHANLYHALMAAIAQLTSLQPADLWVYSLFWARLISAAAIYHLAFVVLGRRWLAWIAAAVFALSAASNSLLSIPNNVGVYALFTLGVAFAVQLLAGARAWQPALALLATCAVLPQFHGLCFLFLVMAVAPLLLAAALHAWLRKRPGRRELALALAGLALGALWFAPQVAQRTQSAPPAAGEAAGSDPEPAEAPAHRHEHPFDGFVQLPGGQWMFDPAPLRDLRSPPTQLLLAIAIGLATRRRRSFLVLAACSAGLLAPLFVPPLCTLALNVAGKGWVVARVWGALYGLQPAIVPGALLLLLEERLVPLALRVPRFLHAALRFLLPLAGLAAGMAVVRATDQERALFPADNRWSTARFAATSLALQVLREERAFVKQAVEPGALLIAHPFQSWTLMLICDCYSLALPRGRDYGLSDAPERRAAVETLLGLDATLDERVSILRRYGAHHLLVTHYFTAPSRALRKLYAPLTVGAVKSNGGVEVLRLNLGARR